MASKRKTVSIADLLSEVNRRNKQSTCSADVRDGWNSLLETVLHNANLYEGYGYLSQEEVPPGEKPGIDKHCRDGAPTRERFPDESRRHYYVSRILKD